MKERAKAMQRDVETSRVNGVAVDMLRSRYCRLLSAILYSSLEPEPIKVDDPRNNIDQLPKISIYDGGSWG